MPWRRSISIMTAVMTPFSFRAITGTCSVSKAETLVAEAEINRLAGAPDQAAACLRAALRIYEDSQATSLAEKVKAALTNDPGDGLA